MNHTWDHYWRGPKETRIPTSFCLVCRIVTYQVGLHWVTYRGVPGDEMTWRLIDGHDEDCDVELVRSIVSA